MKSMRKKLAEIQRREEDVEKREEDVKRRMVDFEERSKLRESSIQDQQKRLKIIERKLKESFVEKKKEKKFKLHIPLKSDGIAGDPRIDQVNEKSNRCFSNVTCAHVKLAMKDELKVESWSNRITTAQITTRLEEEDSDFESEIPAPQRQRLI